MFLIRSVMRQFPFVQKSVEEQKYDLFPIFGYDYSRDGTDKSSLRTEALFRIKLWSKVYISCSQINHRFLPFNSSWSSTVSCILPRHTIQLLQSHLPQDHETLNFSFSLYYLHFMKQVVPTQLLPDVYITLILLFSLWCQISEPLQTSDPYSSTSQNLHCESAFIFVSS